GQLYRAHRQAGAGLADQGRQAAVRATHAHGIRRAQGPGRYRRAAYGAVFIDRTHRPGRGRRPHRELDLSQGSAMNPQIISAAFPVPRPRRLRRDDFTRRLVRENTLTADDLIYPVFVTEGKGIQQAVPSLPGVVRYSLDTLLPVAEQCVELGIPVLSLFPAIDPALKTPDGIEATNPDGLIPRVVRELKKRVPELGVLCDVALDPYTSHGQDGVIDEN